MGHVLNPSRLDGSIIFAGGIGDDLPDINQLGSWRKYRPDFDSQNKLGMDTMNCVQASRMAGCGYLSRFHGKPVNLSDRFMYWASGCSAQGNSFQACDYGFRLRGNCLEESWSWLVAMSRAEYGKRPPEDIIAEALRLFDEWVIGQLRWVDNTSLEAMKAALKKTPLWFCNSNHAMIIEEISDAIHVWDTEANGTGGTGQFPLSYVSQIEACYNIPFTPKGLITTAMKTPIVKIADNALVFEASKGSAGRYGLKITSSKGVQYLIVDDLTKLQAQFISRNAKNNVFSGGAAVSVTTAQFDSFEQATLSGFSQINI
jgi:hypothetical protein